MEKFNVEMYSDGLVASFTGKAASVLRNHKVYGMVAMMTDTTIKVAPDSTDSLLRLRIQGPDQLCHQAVTELKQRVRTVDWIENGSPENIYENERKQQKVDKSGWLQTEDRKVMVFEDEDDSDDDALVIRIKNDDPNNNGKFVLDPYVIAEKKTEKKKQKQAAVKERSKMTERVVVKQQDILKPSIHLPDIPGDAQSSATRFPPSEARRRATDVHVIDAALENLKLEPKTPESPKGGVKKKCPALWKRRQSGERRPADAVVLKCEPASPAPDVVKYLEVANAAKKNPPVPKITTLKTPPVPKITTQKTPPVPKITTQKTPPVPKTIPLVPKEAEEEKIQAETNNTELNDKTAGDSPTKVITPSKVKCPALWRRRHVSRAGDQGPAGDALNLEVNRKIDVNHNQVGMTPATATPETAPVSADAVPLPAETVTAPVTETVPVSAADVDKQTLVKQTAAINTSQDTCPDNVPTYYGEPHTRIQGNFTTRKNASPFIGNPPPHTSANPAAIQAQKDEVNSSVAMPLTPPEPGAPDDTPTRTGRVSLWKRRQAQAVKHRRRSGSSSPQADLLTSPSHQSTVEGDAFVIYGCPVSPKESPFTVIEEIPLPGKDTSSALGSNQQTKLPIDRSSPIEKNDISKIPLPPDSDSTDSSLETLVAAAAILNLDVSQIPLPSCSFDSFENEEKPVKTTKTKMTVAIPVQARSPVHPGLSSDEIRTAVRGLPTGPGSARWRRELFEKGMMERAKEEMEDMTISDDSSPSSPSNGRFRRHSRDIALNFGQGRLEKENTPEKQTFKKFVRSKVDSVQEEFGFLSHEEEDGKKLFYHMTEVADGVYELKPGDDVEFDIVRRNGKYAAVNIKKIRVIVTPRPERLRTGLKKAGQLQTEARVFIIRQPKGPDGTKGFRLNRAPRTRTPSRSSAYSLIRQ